MPFWVSRQIITAPSKYVGHPDNNLLYNPKLGKLTPDSSGTTSKSRTSWPQQRLLGGVCAPELGGLPDQGVRCYTDESSEGCFFPDMCLFAGAGFGLDTAVVRRCLGMRSRFKIPGAGFRFRLFTSSHNKYQEFYSHGDGVLLAAFRRFVLSLSYQCPSRRSSPSWATGNPKP